MSLDVYLELPGEPIPVAAEGRIFVRRDGATVEITRAEWDDLQPGREPVAMVAETDGRQVYDANITHNLGRMADECGLYLPLWCPDDATHAEQLIEPLRNGLERLRSDPARYQKFDPPNGWGDYDLLVRFTENYLAACEQWPQASVRVWK